MLTKGHIKLITSLSQKKFRQEHQLFVVEGMKGIEEFLKSNFELFQLFSTEKIFNVDYVQITATELQKISNLSTPNKALAVFRIPKPTEVHSHDITLALDEVRDPGNLGTIIRLCDWFGIKNLICSKGTVDCYNPKVVQATMGSLTRVHIEYVELATYIKNSNSEIFGTFMNGDIIYDTALPSQGIIIMGNEANGISNGVEALVTKRLCIPRFGNLKATESLNVATAAAIVLSEFKRNF